MRKVNYEERSQFVVRWPGTTLLRNNISVERPVGSREQASIPAEYESLDQECAQEWEELGRVS
jgi:hypothetical protein